MSNESHLLSHTPAGVSSRLIRPTWGQRPVSFTPQSAQLKCDSSERHTLHTRLRPDSHIISGIVNEDYKHFVK